MLEFANPGLARGFRLGCIASDLVWLFSPKNSHGLRSDFNVAEK